MKKKINKIIVFITVVTVLASCFVNFTSCKKGTGKIPETKITYVYDDKTLPLATEYDESYEAFPKTENVSKKTIYCLDITGCEYSDMFMTVVLQGIVNRDAPELYLIHDYIVQAASATFNSSQYWLDALDQSYFEEDGTTPYYNKEYISSVTAAVAKYYSKIKGVVLYHSRLMIRNVMASQDNGPSIYGDMAVLNLTEMMCEQYDALPMTLSKFNAVNSALTELGLKPLTVVADSRELMAKDDDGIYLSNTSSVDVWYDCYRYALDKIKCGDWKFSDEILAHNGTFNAANFDYLTAHKIFTYNRIYEGSVGKDITTKQIAALETEIMGITKVNTPVIGVYHLTGDEEGNVRYVNNYGKYFVVTHETWDLSWTCGLERVVAKEKTEKLVYDESKNYVAITYSESDNNSYCHFKLPMVYDSEARGNFSMTWALSTSCVDLNPNVIQYINATMAEGDGYAMGESGIGYIRNENVLEEYQAEFFGLTNLYGEYLNPSIRTLLNNLVQAMDYCTYMENLTSILSGYAGISSEGTNEYNSDRANYYFHDKAIFQNFCCSEAADVDTMLGSIHSSGSLYSIGMYGWAGDLNALWNAVSKYTENTVFVTESQLADLFIQKMSAEYNNITSADYDCDSRAEEVAYIWYSNNYKNYQQAYISGQEEYRYGKNEDFVIYRYDFDETVTSAVLTYDILGEYKIECSSDLKNWAQIYEESYIKDVSNVRHQAQFSIPSTLCGKAIYVRISDITPEDGTGYRIFHCNLITNVNDQNIVDIDTRYDSQYYVSGSDRTADGYRTGEVVYSLPLSDDISVANITVEADDDITFAFSSDGKNYYYSSVNKYDRSDYDGYGNYYSLTTTTIVSGMRIKITSSGAIKMIRFNKINSYNEFEFSSVESDFDTNNCAIGLDSIKITSGFSSCAQIGNATLLEYAFMMGNDNKKPVLKVLAGGMFEISISADGKNWTTLKRVEAGENIDNELVFDISAYAKAGGVYRIRITKSSTSGGVCSLYYMKLVK